MTGEIAAVDGVLSFGPFRLFRTERLLEESGQSLALGSRAMDILIALTEKAGQVVDRRELMARAWPNLVVEDANLRVHMAALRKALKDGHAGARYITNIPGRGYVFVAPVAHETGPVPRPGRLRAGVSTAARPDRSEHGLPPLPTPLVGREALILAVSQAFETRRLITLVGPAGIGKTTAAVAVARTQLASFADGIRFIDLGMLTAGEMVSSTLAAALSLPIQATDPMSALLAFLRDRTMLLILDCCEHVIDSVARLAERVMQETQSVYILATSREALRIADELIHSVEALPCPPLGTEMTAAKVLDYPAMQLFVARVSGSRPTFELGDADAPIAAEICRRLEGVALAIEIVAGRIEPHGFQKANELLNKQFELVWKGRRTAVPRHQTLSAAIDWSYDLLKDPEQLVLRRLAAFRGPFELQAAQHIVADSRLKQAQIAEILATLVDKSLVTIESDANGVRYRLFDTTRSYLLTKLIDGGEADVILERHARYWLHFVERVEADAPQRGSEGFANCAPFIGSIRSALEWSFADGGNPQLGSALAAVAAPLFLELSLVSECYHWTKRGLAALPQQTRDGPLAMKLLAGLGLSAMVANGNAEEVRTSLRRGLEIAGQLGEAYSALRFLGPLHLFSCRIADFRAALDAAERCAVLAEQIADPSVTTMANSMLAAGHHLRGNIRTSKHHCEAALSETPASQNIHRVYLGLDHRNRALCVYAQVLWILGYCDQALEAANFTLDETGVGEHPVTLGIAFWTLSVLIWVGDLDRAEAILERLSVRVAKFSLQPYRAMVLGQQGGIAIRRGNAARGVVLLQEALRMAARCYAMVTTVYLKELAEGLIHLGRTAEALQVLDKASARIDSNGDRLHWPELLRLRGDALAAAGSADAEHTLRAALDAARREEAVSWELRAAMSLCRLHRTRGTSQEGDELLAASYARFREGFNSADLLAAAKLLNAPAHARLPYSI